MNYRILQISDFAPERRQWRYERLPDGVTEVPGTMYVRVYQGETEETLEGLFQMFNLDRPSDYYGRSLSVSDVVQISTNSGDTWTSYYCDSYGWVEVKLIGRPKQLGKEEQSICKMIRTLYPARELAGVAARIEELCAKRDAIAAAKFANPQ